jgi:hypothetical protein
MKTFLLSILATAFTVIVSVAAAGPCGDSSNCDPTQGSGNSLFAVIQAMAPSLRLEVKPISVREVPEIKRAVAAFARAPNGGLILTPGGAATPPGLGGFGLSLCM